MIKLFIVGVLLVLYLGEAVFQLMPLVKGKPYGSRRAYLCGIGIYSLTIIMVMFNLDLAVPIILGKAVVGLGKEGIGYLLLKELKEGYKI